MDFCTGYELSKAKIEQKQRKQYWYYFWILNKSEYSDFKKSDGYFDAAYDGGTIGAKAAEYNSLAISPDCRIKANLLFDDLLEEQSKQYDCSLAKLTKRRLRKLIIDYFNAIVLGPTAASVVFNFEDILDNNPREGFNVFETLGQLITLYKNYPKGGIIILTLEDIYADTKEDYYAHRYFDEGPDFETINAYEEALEKYEKEQEEQERFLEEESAQDINWTEIGSPEKLHISNKDIYEKD